MPDVFIDADGILHEVTAYSDYAPRGVIVRCHAQHTRDLLGLGNGPVTCLACIGWVDVEYDTCCQYCGVKTGTIPYAWATEDIFDKCAAAGPQQEL